MDTHDSIGRDVDLNSILRRYQSLVEMSPEAIFTHDGISISYVNDAAVTLFGAGSATQLVARSPYDLFHPDYHNLMRERITDVLAGKSVPFIENRALRLDGSAIDVEIRASSFFENGKPMVQVLLHDISERKAAQKLLHESEERYRSLFQGYPVSSVVFQAAGNDFVIVDYNRESLVFTGNRMADFAGRKASELYGSHPELLDMFADVFKNKGVQKIGLQYQKLSTGEDIYLKVTMSFIEPDKILFLSEDHTELKKPEKALQESEARWRYLVDVMPSGVAVFDVINDGDDFIFKDINPAGERIDKVKRDEIMGKTLYEFFPNAVEMGLVDVFKRVWKTGIPECLPVTHYKDGNLSVWVTNSVWKGPSGELVALFDDITEQKKAEDALKKSEQLYRAIGESIDYGIWICEPDGRNIYASESFLNLVGITQEQCSNYGWGDVLHPDDAERTIAAWKECVKAEGTWDMEHRYKGVDGQWHPILARGIPVRDEHGSIIFWAGINLDVSRLKQAEELLQRHAAELTAANHNLEDFAHSITHDLRNPLNAILSNSEVAKQSIPPEDKDGHKAIEYIASSTNRMASIISDLMSLMQVTSQEVKLKQCNLSDMAQAILEELKLFESTRRVVSTIEPGVFVEADEGLIWILMQNLLHNAWKFTSKRPDSRIEFGKQCVGESSVYYVRDNGVGFDMSKADKLFKPYQRLHSRKDYSGTGIGLTIVKRIIEKHGGTITVEAEEDKGATFLFSLGS